MRITKVLALTMLLAGCDPGQVETAPPPPGSSDTSTAMMVVAAPPAPDAGAPHLDATPAAQDTLSAPPVSADAGAAPPVDSQPAPAPKTYPACSGGTVVPVDQCGEETAGGGFRNKRKDGMICGICAYQAPGGYIDTAHPLTSCTFGGMLCVASCAECTY